MHHLRPPPNIFHGDKPPNDIYTLGVPRSLNPWSTTAASGGWLGGRPLVMFKLVRRETPRRKYDTRPQLLLQCFHDVFPPLLSSTCAEDARPLYRRSSAGRNAPMSAIKMWNDAQLRQFSGTNWRSLLSAPPSEWPTQEQNDRSTSRENFSTALKLDFICLLSYSFSLGCESCTFSLEGASYYVNIFWTGQRAQAET